MIHSYTFHILHVCSVVIAFHMIHRSILSYEYKYLVNDGSAIHFFLAETKKDFAPKIIYPV